MKGFIYFTAAWCQPCQTLGPIMDEIGRAGMPVKKINVDYDTQFVQEYNVRNIPTIVLYEQNGRGELGRRTGVQTQQSLTEWFNNA
jgi:thioredoxin 1